MSGAYAQAAEAVCPHCGAAVRVEDNCCWHCGERLPKGKSWCPECGRRFTGGEQNCPNCGTATLPGEPPQARRPEPESEPEPEPERAQRPGRGESYDYDARKGCYNYEERRGYDQGYGRGYDSGFERGYREARRRGLSSRRNWLLALILSAVLGVFGVHRFYVGKIGTGILWLLTGGCLGIGWLVDLIVIACGRFRDKEGFLLTPEKL